MNSSPLRSMWNTRVENKRFYSLFCFPYIDACVCVFYYFKFFLRIFLILIRKCISFLLLLLFFCRRNIRVAHITQKKIKQASQFDLEPKTTTFACFSTTESTAHNLSIVAKYNRTSLYR
jgi:hypothetical protein